MTYTPQTIRLDIARIGTASWDWAGANPGVIRPDLRSRNPTLDQTATTGLTNAALQEELAEYCWTCYSKTLASKGHMVIGRVSDLTAAGLHEKVADIGAGQYLFDHGTQGNLLRMDKWARVVNDAWLLGGVHRRATFRLASRITMGNLWNSNGGYFVVTAREIAGLLHFGYQYKRVGPWQVLTSENQGKAANANLVEYDNYINRIQSHNTARTLLVMLG